MKKTFNVNGMHCSHCMKRVAEILKQFPGVIRARVSLKRHQASIIMDENTNLKAMMELLEQAGYPLEEIDR
ncbi:MAG: heavy metal-associated domain-containing protein [Candidatus Izemoplasmatales bacterium]|jgi:copper chaperone CopZ|nr:heavy metal-associated domain-containing protein [Candidatus Izemoplasmatales bacterium]MDD5293626.1 heavy metal-associated domain-containing protein [Candidatus Izemoplasmatales bacterium]